MSGLCKIVLIGYLGADPETRQTQSGLLVTNCNLAVTEKIKGEDKTQWFRVIAFGKLAEICQNYLAKGKQVYVEGRLQTSEWQDREGNKRFTLEVIANNLQMLGSRTESSEYDSDAQKQSAAVNPSGADDYPELNNPPSEVGDGEPPF